MKSVFVGIGHAGQCTWNKYVRSPSPGFAAEGLGVKVFGKAALTAGASPQSRERGVHSSVGNSSLTPTPLIRSRIICCASTGFGVRLRVD